MSLRKVTSLTTLLSFILLIITSVVLYITPQGKIAFWANWNCWGISKEGWCALHTNLGILFLVAGLIHTILNWKPIVAYMKNKAKKLKVFTIDLNAALVITLFITIFTFFELPPISGVQNFNRKLKEAAAEQYGEPPYGHAESSSLKSFCRRTGLDLEESLKKLETADLKSASAEATLTEIAKANGMTPQQVYGTIKPMQARGGKTKGPMRPGSGLGRKSLSNVCAESGLDVVPTIARLKGLGIEATAESTMKEIGEKNDMTPYSVLETMQQLHE
ncbi:MAG: DUF4405 domain-containing protein [Verrucomicrobia bacterium]|nr:DUF4405 domain-containing protein [Verrucomicrobiota bacterium]